MDWEAVGALAELVGAIGVIATLFYLSSQIRRNSRALEAGTNQAVADATQERLLTMAQNPELAAAYAKTSIGEQLSPTEEVQVTFFTRATFRGVQNAFFQHRAGLISEEAWRDYEQVLRNIARGGHMGEWWRRERSTFDENFASHYEKMISNVAVD